MAKNTKTHNTGMAYLSPVIQASYEKAGDLKWLVKTTPQHEVTEKQS